jgi:hypothetical protein
MPAGFGGEVSAAVQWAAPQLQHEPAATPRHTWLRQLGKMLMAVSSIIFGLQGQLRTQPGYWQMMLPAAQLAWMLLEAEQQAAAAGSSSSSDAGAAHGKGAAPSSRAQKQQQQRLIDGVPGAVLEFLQVFGVAVYTGLPRAPQPLVEQLCSSEEVMQLLLAFTALSVGAAHKLVAATTPKAASRRSSSSSSKRQGGGKHSSTAAAAAAGEVPASHLDLLAALSSPLHKQISRQYARNPNAGDYGSFKSDSVEQAQHRAVLVLNGLYSVFKLREELLDGGDVGATLLEAMGEDGSSSSSSSIASSSFHAAVGGTVVPREQQLLMPLLLTLVDYMQLMPGTGQGVVPLAMQLFSQAGKQAGLKAPVILPGGTAAAAAAASTIGAVSEAALIDGLTAPVLLQLGPVALQYLRDAAAAGANPQASALEALMGGSAAAAGPQEAFVVTGCLAVTVMEILATGAS